MGIRAEVLPSFVYRLQGSSEYVTRATLHKLSAHTVSADTEPAASRLSHAAADTHVGTHVMFHDTFHRLLSS